MPRVPPSGGPPKILRPLAKPAHTPKPGTSGAPGKVQLPLRSRRGLPRHIEEKAIKLKSGNDENEVAVTEARPADPNQDPHEHARNIESWLPESNADKAEEKKRKEEIEELEEEAHGSEDGPAAASGAKKFVKQVNAVGKGTNNEVEAQNQKKQADAFEAQKQRMQQIAAKAAQAQAAQHVREAAALNKATPAESAPKKAPDKPPDAISVLHSAQEPGVFYKEEGHNGQAELANPELTEAIEESIRVLFGVRGILRVSGGFNQENEPAIIIVAAQGFGEASMKLIPPRVHRFQTILAVPYDVLPLKRERL